MSEALRLNDATGDVVRVPGVGAIIATGVAVPSNGGVGFAPGCIFISYGTYSSTTAIYINSGTNSSATWTALTIN